MVLSLYSLVTWLLFVMEVDSILLLVTDDGLNHPEQMSKENDICFFLSALDLSNVEYILSDYLILFEPPIPSPTQCSLCSQSEGF